MACAALVTTLGVSSARADSGHATIDWGQLLVDLDHYARHGAEQATPPTRASLNERTSQIYEHTAGTAWFGVAPRVALVARDWGEAYRLAGDRLSLVDAMRLSSSTRMVLTRVRLSESGGTRVTPFAQLGAGQWRTDPNLLPLTPRSTEIAAQLGGGVEVHMTRAWQLACELSATLLIRDQREEGNIPETKLWSTMLASRVDF